MIERSAFDLTDPANEAALRVLVENLLAQSETDRAFTAVAAALARNPELPAFHDIRGTRALERGKNC